MIASVETLLWAIHARQEAWNTGCCRCCLVMLCHPMTSTTRSSWQDGTRERGPFAGDPANRRLRHDSTASREPNASQDCGSTVDDSRVGLAFCWQCLGGIGGGMLAMQDRLLFFLAAWPGSRTKPLAGLGTGYGHSERQSPPNSKKQQEASRTSHRPWWHESHTDNPQAPRFSHAGGPECTNEQDRGWYFVCQNSLARGGYITNSFHAASLGGPALTIRWEALETCLGRRNGKSVTYLALDHYG